ncbi:MAG: hypothetical protein MUF15_04105 [Acidobacteria bacterium]|jgi:hypothetical protein|nr:hypothetical protein [Acidobacteriota bacterium]
MSFKIISAKTEGIIEIQIKIFNNLSHILCLKINHEKSAPTDNKRKADRRDMEKVIKVEAKRFEKSPIIKLMIRRNSDFFKITIPDKIVEIDAR